MLRSSRGAVRLVAAVVLHACACDAPSCDAELGSEPEPASGDDAELCPVAFVPEVEPDLSYAELADCDPRHPVRRQPVIQPAVAAARFDEHRIIAIDRIGRGNRRIFQQVDQSLVRQWGAIDRSDDEDPDFVYEALSGSDDLELILRRSRVRRDNDHLYPDEFVLAIPTAQAASLSLAAAFEIAKPLESLQECSVEPYPAQDPLALQIEFVVSDADRNVILVERNFIADPADYYVFYGPSTAIQQRDLIDHDVRRDGGTTITRFVTEAGEAVLIYPAMCDEGPTPFDCPGLLTIGDRELSVTPKGRDRSLPDGSRFLCATMRRPP